MKNKGYSARNCSLCIFIDVCAPIKGGCDGFYAGEEEWPSAEDEREAKIEYLEAWEAYIEGF